MNSFLKYFIYLFIIALGVLLSGKADAQKDTATQQLAFEATLHGGFTIPHGEEIRHLIQGHALGVGLSAEWKTTGNKYWHHAYRQPSVGIDLFHAGMGNPSQLGTGTAATFNIQLPINKSQKFRQYIKPGFGFGYVSKRYDQETNSRNFAIGSKVNAAVLLEYGCEIAISNKLKIIPGIRLNHFSNGAYQKPNLGLNIPSVFLGVQWVAREGDSFTEKQPKPETDKMVYTSFVGFGVTENLPPGGDKHLAYTWSNMVERRITFKSSLALGVDVMYNNALLDRENESNGLTVPDIKVQMGAFFGYTMHLSKFRILVQTGAYMLDEFKENGFIYNRFGLRYNLNKHWEAGLHLKTHFIVADYFEAGIAYRF